MLLARHARPCAGHPRLTAFARRKTWMAGTSPAMTTSKASQQHQRFANLSRKRGLGLFSDRLERRRLVDGEIRQHLAVDRDARLGKAVDKDAVSHAERTHGGIEALNPQRAEGALLALAVAEGVLRGLLDRGLCGADGVLAAAVKALGGLVDFLVLGVRGHTAFDARHDGSPSYEKSVTDRRADAARL